MYINHLTLSTGHLSRIERGDVAGETIARVAPWIEAGILATEPVPLPVSALSAYSARLLTQDGSLVATVYGPGGAALVTAGVAKRSRHAAGLWPLLIDMPGTKARIQRPAEPWCAVALLPALMLDLDAMRWLGDFERCIAWAWVTRPTDSDA